MCGFATHPEQLKKDGSPMWHCAFKFPFDYHVLLDENDKVIKSFTEKEELPKAKKGQRIEKRHYSGCPRHNTQEESPLDDDFDF